jgi:RNase H-fold protein (predicted Holliday junction resolvase)
VMGVDRRLYYHEVVTAEDTIAVIQSLRQQFPVSLLVMGDQTSSKAWRQKLTTELAEPLRVITVDERHSSLEARDRYWQMYPPTGLTLLVPKGMRTPPRSIDDIVAILLIERYLQRLTDKSG